MDEADLDAAIAASAERAAQKKAQKLPSRAANAVVAVPVTADVDAAAIARSGDGITDTCGGTRIPKKGQAAAKSAAKRNVATADARANGITTVVASSTSTASTSINADTSSGCTLPPIAKSVKKHCVLATFTAHGVYINLEELALQLSAEQVRKVCAALTYKYVAKIGKKQMSETIYEFYRIQNVDGRRYLVVARCGEFFSEALRSNPLFSWRTKCTIPPGAALITRAEAEHALAQVAVKDAAEPYPAGIQLNENQQIVKAHLLAGPFSPKSIAAGHGSAILVSPTGSGKSYMGVELAVHFGRKTLIVLPNKNNLSEWRSIISSQYPHLRLGEYGTKRKVDGDVVIVMIGTLIKAELNFTVPKVRGAKVTSGAASPSDSSPNASSGTAPTHNAAPLHVGSIEILTYLRTFGTVIYDEIHNYASKKRLDAFWNCSPLHQLGLTATPDERADGMDRAYYQHVGPRIVATELPGYNHTVGNFSGQAILVKYAGLPEYTAHHTSSLGYFDAGAGNQMVSEDPRRRKLACNIIAHALARGRNIFVFAERLEQIAELQLAAVFPSAKLVGGQTEETNIEAKRAQIIIMTYSFGSESISIPRMDTILFYTSRRNKMIQKLGRIERGGGDESIIREVYDIVDVRTKLKDQLCTRKLAYTNKQYEIITHKVEEDVSWPPPEVPEPDAALARKPAAKRAAKSAAVSGADASSKPRAKRAAAAAGAPTAAPAPLCDNFDDVM